MRFKLGWAAGAYPSPLEGHRVRPGAVQQGSHFRSVARRAKGRTARATGDNRQGSDGPAAAPVRFSLYPTRVEPKTAGSEVRNSAAPSLDQPAKVDGHFRF